MTTPRRRESSCSPFASAIGAGITTQRFDDLALH